MAGWRSRSRRRTSLQAIFRAHRRRQRVRRAPTPEPLPSPSRRTGPRNGGATNLAWRPSKKRPRHRAHPFQRRSPAHVRQARHAGSRLDCDVRPSSAAIQRCTVRGVTPTASAVRRVEPPNNERRTSAPESWTGRSADGAQRPVYVRPVPIHPSGAVRYPTTSPHTPSGSRMAWVQPRSE